MKLLGDLIYGKAGGSPAVLTGDTSNTRKFLRELSAGGVAAAPVWDTLLAGDLTGAILKDGSVAYTGAQSMGSHQVNFVTDPTSAQDAATKNYVDNAVQALAAKDDCQTATATTLAAYTYANVATPPSGVGATITLTVAAVLVLDGYTVLLGDRVLVKNETGGNAPYNGIYSLTRVGVALGATAVLTRTTDFDQPGDGINGALTFILNGTANGNTLWSCTAAAAITFGTTNINWSAFTGSTYTADEVSLHLSGTTFSILSTWVGQAAITTVGTIGTGVWNGTPVVPTYGGTGLATLTAHGVLIGEGTSNVAVTTAGSAGQVLTSGGASADPTFKAVALTNTSAFLAATFTMTNGNQ
jgi:hypothetical protein